MGKIAIVMKISPQFLECVYLYVYMVALINYKQSVNKHYRTHYSSCHQRDRIACNLGVVHLETKVRKISITSHHETK